MWNGFQVLDLLGLLVDKSLVLAEHTGGATRYRLLETVRQYVLEKLGESGQAHAVRARHRDHYSSIAAMLDTPAPTGHESASRAGRHRDRQPAGPLSRGAAKTPDITDARWQLASSLQPLWLARGAHPGRDVLARRRPRRSKVHSPAEVSPAVRARALADNATLNAFIGATDSLERACEALAIAREVDDPALLAPGLDRLRCKRGLRPRGGPPVRGRGDRPGPLDRATGGGSARYSSWQAYRVGHGG